MKTATARADASTATGLFSLSPAKRQALRWFIRAPARMALDPGLSHPAFRLASLLLHYEGELGCFPSQERLSKNLNLSLDSVQRYLRELELYGFLVREKRGRRTNYSLEPLYEAPIGHGSLEETGQLEVENLAKRRPPSPRTLRRRVSDLERPQRPVTLKAIAGIELERSVSSDDEPRSTAPVRS
ncbi:MAG: helix-turn-helix domain-containing protein, partial [Candidatus Dormibacteria bacterium]